MIPCPVAPCATQLQPARTGSLSDGVALHLMTVHGWPQAEAVARAFRHVQEVPAT